MPQSRAGVGTDHTLAVERVVQPRVAHVVLEDVGDRRLEDDVDHRPIVSEELFDLGPGRGITDPCVAGTGTQPSPDLVEDRLVGPVPLDVLRGDAESFEVVLRTAVVGPLPERRTIGKRRPQVGIGHEHLEASARQLELVDHQAVE